MNGHEFANETIKFFKTVSTTIDKTACLGLDGDVVIINAHPLLIMETNHDTKTAMETASVVQIVFFPNFGRFRIIAYCPLYTNAGAIVIADAWLYTEARAIFEETVNFIGTIPDSLVASNGVKHERKS